jgi:hypothetical protein
MHNEEESDRFCSQWLNGALLPPRRAGLSSMMLFFVTKEKEKLNENDGDVVRTYTPIDPTLDCPKEKATMSNNGNERATVEKGMNVAHWKVFSFELELDSGQASYSIGAWMYAGTAALCTFLQ